MEKKAKFGIIFVCTGNTCRSPMAEFMFKAYLKEKKRSADFAVSSAGLYAQRGDILSSTADECLDVLGVKHNKERKAKPFTVMMAEDNALIVAMTARHAELIGEGDGGRVISFDEIIGRPVDDPFGGSLQSYINCATTIRSAFDKLLDIADGMIEENKKAK